MLNQADGAIVKSSHWAKGDKSPTRLINWPLPLAGGAGGGHVKYMPQFKERPTLRAQQLRNNATKAERLLWRHLSRRQVGGQKFSRQMPIGTLICDLLCRERKLIVEVDGGQHCENARDVARTAYLESQGFRVVRFWNNEVTQNIEGVIQSIAQALSDPPPPAPPASVRGEK